MKSYERKASSYTFSSSFFGKEENEKENSSSILIKQSGSLTPYTTKLVTADSVTPLSHHCNNFAFPPPPPPNRRRIGPRRKCENMFCIILFVFFSRIMFSSNKRTWCYYRGYDS